MKIKLIFDDWRKRSGKSCYSDVACDHLSRGEFHSGTTFNGTIELDEADEGELREALRKGYRPVFWAMEE